MPRIWNWKSHVRTFLLFPGFICSKETKSHKTKYLLALAGQGVREYPPAECPGVLREELVIWASLPANSQVFLGCQTSYRFLKPRIPSYLSQHQSFFLFSFFLQEGIVRWNWVRGIGSHPSFSDLSLRVLLLCLGFPWNPVGSFKLAIYFSLQFWGTSHLLQKAILVFKRETRPKWSHLSPNGKPRHN